MNKRFSAIVVLAVLFFIPVLASADEDKDKNTFFGMGVFLGKQIKYDPVWHISGAYDWQVKEIHPYYGWVISDRWQVWFEGNIGQYSLKSKDEPRKECDVFEFGASIMTSYDVIKWQRWSLFPEVGVGLGYWNKSPSRKLLQPDILGLINYGVGIRAPLPSLPVIGENVYLKIGCRFNHTSSIPGKDTGANSDMVYIGIVNYF